MPSNTIKIRARKQGEVTTVKALISHPMETGLRKDSKTGEKIPAHFIQEVVAEVNGEQVMKGLWGIGISKNPYLSFKLTGASSGDTLKLSWSDNKGQSDSTTTEIR